MSRVRGSVGVDGVFDIETEAWDLYVLGGWLSSAGEYRSTRDPEELALWICRSKGDWWAHNGGHYDALWLLSVLHAWRTPDVKIALAGSRVTCVELGELRVRDSYALIPMGLAKGAELGGSAKVATGFKCDCGGDCGGYCRIRRGMPEADYRTLDGYLEADCRATLAMLRAVSAWCAERDVPMRGTIGGTAWADVQKRSGIKPAAWAAGHYEVARTGYYGGRVEVFRPRADAGWRYDRNSSYPAALVETELPVGTPRLYGREAGRIYREGREGIYQAEVEVPALFIPPLPLRLSDRLAYPVGKFEGAWTALHLRRAEERGAKILRVGWAIAWPEARRELRPWCEWVWSERARHPPDTAWNRWIKWLANSLTGKLAQRPDHESAMLGIPKRTECPGGACRGPHPKTRCCDHRCTGRCGCWHPLGPTGRIWARTEWRRPTSGHVQWASYLTASAEVELDRQLCEAGDGAVYCDTDSVYSTCEVTRGIGAELGEWKLEGRFESGPAREPDPDRPGKLRGVWMQGWTALAPKLYRYRDPSKPAAIVRGKGMSRLTAAGMRALEGGAPHVVDTGVESFLTVARRGGALFHRTRLSRSYLGDGRHFGGRVLGPDGRTYAMTAGHLLSLTDDTETVSSGAGQEGGPEE